MGNILDAINAVKHLTSSTFRHDEDELLLKSKTKPNTRNTGNKLHLGPGPNWEKPNNGWINIDVDANRADLVINFNDFKGLPYEDFSISCIYGSHVFEHIDIFNAPKVFKECHRVLTNGGYFRIVLPDVKKSIEEYLKGNIEFPLFRRRIESLEKLMNVKEVCIFEALKGDFISPSGQQNIFGKNSLAHQNAWDYEAICLDLKRAGFSAENIRKQSFKVSDCNEFNFEGSFLSEANEYDRSIYVEVKK